MRESDTRLLTWIIWIYIFSQKQFAPRLNGTQHVNREDATKNFLVQYALSGNNTNSKMGFTCTETEEPRKNQVHPDVNMAPNMSRQMFVLFANEGTLYYLLNKGTWKRGFIMNHTLKFFLAEYLWVLYGHYSFCLQKMLVRTSKHKMDFQFLVNEIPSSIW